MPVSWLVIIDVLLIAAGVGVFYLFLGLVPEAYEVVAAPTQPAHPTARVVAQVPATVPSATRAVAIVSEVHTTAPTDTPTTEKTATPASRKTSAPTPSRTPAPGSTGTRPPAHTPTRSLLPTATVVPTQTPLPPAAASPAAGGSATGAELSKGKFAGRFTSGEVVRTATSYQSANVNVTLSKVQRGDVTLYVQDIYARYIDNLRTAFARNTYGRHIAGWTVDIANANGAIGAINGDYYGAGKIGAVIRSGVLYNGTPDGEVGVLFRDGTMRVYGANEFDAEQVMAAGAYQAWDFGPGLMTPEGKAIGVFGSGIAGRNPRTAFGYFEPGHYAFVVVDGRQTGYSNGMTLAQLAALFEELGCKAAYNLDGGQTSAMTFGGQVVNRPFRGGRQTSDIIFVGE